MSQVHAVQSGTAHKPPSQQVTKIAIDELILQVADSKEVFVKIGNKFEEISVQKTGRAMKFPDLKAELLERPLLDSHISAMEIAYPLQHHLVHITKPTITLFRKGEIKQEDFKPVLSQIDAFRKANAGSIEKCVDQKKGFLKLKELLETSRKELSKFGDAELAEIVSKVEAIRRVIDQLTREMTTVPRKHDGEQTHKANNDHKKAVQKIHQQVQEREQEMKKLVDEQMEVIEAQTLANTVVENLLPEAMERLKWFEEMWSRIQSDLEFVQKGLNRLEEKAKNVVTNQSKISSNPMKYLEAPTQSSLGLARSLLEYAMGIDRGLNENKAN